MHMLVWGTISIIYSSEDSSRTHSELFVFVHVFSLHASQFQVQHVKELHMRRVPLLAW